VVNNKENILTKRSLDRDTRNTMMFQQRRLPSAQFRKHLVSSLENMLSPEDFPVASLESFAMPN